MTAAAVAAATAEQAPGPVPAARKGFAAHWPHLLPPVLAAMVAAPWLGRGYLLGYDLVFTPSMPLSSSLLGMGTGLPRAVPSNLVLALLQQLLPGDLLQRVVLIGLLLGAGWGVLVWLRSAPNAVRAVAAIAYLWSPYLYERLAIGQWAVLIGWAALPWTVHLCGRLGDAARERAPAASVRLALLLSVPAVGGFAAQQICALGVLAVGLTTTGAARVRVLLVGLGACALWSLPWLVPTLTHPGGAVSDPAGVAAFTARADTRLGSLGSVLTLGGIWNGLAAPPGRDSWAGSLCALALLLLALAGARRLTAHLGRRLSLGLALMSALAVAVAVAGLVPGVRVLFADALPVVPGLASVRDGQRLIAVLALLECAALGFGAAALADRLHRLQLDRRLSFAIVALLPLVAVPSLAWGLAGTLTPVGVPSDYLAAARVVDASPGAGAVMVAPWGLYRPYDWNNGRPVVDIATLLMSRYTITDTDLPVAVGGSGVIRSVPGEDPWSARIGRIISGPGDHTRQLAAAGIGFVYLEQQPPAVGGGTVQGLAGATAVYRSPDVTVYRLPGPIAAAPAGVTSPDRLHLIEAADLLVLLVLGTLAAALLLPSGAPLSLRRPPVGAATQPATEDQLP
jgi:hypothetical protein